MTLTEPTTFATDLGLAALSAFFAVRLLRDAREPGRAPVLRWGLGFAALAAASLLGGLDHGLGPGLGPGPDRALWKSTLLALGAAAFLLLAAAIVAASRPPRRGRWTALAAADVGIAALVVAARGEFAGAVALYGGALILVVAILHAAPACRGGPAKRWVMGGVAVSAVAGAVQQSGFHLHPSFNHNDLYHVLQVPGLWLLYRGGNLLRDPAQDC